jgi:two-component system, NarL family, invasion response regulator UvrY
VLAPAIRHIFSGRKFLSQSLAQELAIDLAHKRSGQVHETLSNREYQVFVQLGAETSIDEIASELKLSPKTVRTYRSRILEKTNLKSTAEIIFYAIEHGLVTHVADASTAGHSHRPHGDRS